MSANRLPILAVAFSLPAIIANANPAMTAPSSASGRAEGNLPRPRAAGPLGPLVDLTIQRLLIGDQVAAAKFGSGQPIHDPIRENQELTRIRREALEAGIDPEPAAAFFRDQFMASKVVQNGLFQLWTARPDLAPVPRPDLGRLRVQLDELTTEIMRCLVATEHLRNSSLACQVDLTTARLTGEVHNHLDALHRQALSVGLRSICWSIR